MANPYNSSGQSGRKPSNKSNRNRHPKKNGSNYHPDRPAAPQPAQNTRQQSWTKLPLPGKVLFFVILALLVAVLILRVAIFPDSLVMANIASLILGLACIGLFFMRRLTSTTEGSGATVLNLVLIALGVLYLFLGVTGLYNMIA